MPKLSIIVPIYNVENYLAACLDSILTQTFRDFEVILVNDGSTDTSGKICDAYGKKDGRIRVIHKENGGVSSARNVGIDASNGTYLAFVDPDDFLEPTMYEVLIMAVQKYNVDMAVSRIKTKNFHTNTMTISAIWGKAETPIDKQTIATEIIPSIVVNKTYSLVSVFNKVYHRKLFTDLGIRFDETMHFAEDARLNFTILTKIDAFVYVDEPLYHYFIHQRASSVQQFREDMYAYIRSNKQFLLTLCEKYHLEAYRKKVREHFMNATLNHLDDVVKGELSYASKVAVVGKILHDVEFRSDLSMYPCPTKYRQVVKFLCMVRNTHLLLFFMACKNNWQQLFWRKLYSIPTRNW